MIGVGYMLLRSAIWGQREWMYGPDSPNPSWKKRYGTFLIQQFAACLSAVASSFVNEAHTPDAAEDEALQEQARSILRSEGRRRRQKERRARASEAKERARQKFAELTQRAPDVADQEEDQSPENAGVDSMPRTLPSRTSGCIPTIREITQSIAVVARGLVSIVR